MNPKSKVSQGGSVLVEAMLAIVIFSFGVLGIMGLQAKMIVSAADAKYRSEAGFYVNRLLGEMGAADRLTPAAMNVFASSPAGASYNAWYNDIQNATITSGLLGLPGAAAHPPVVKIRANYNLANPTYPISYDVTATVYWQTPGQTGQPVHQHVVAASISAD